jgi:hypothetical protein
LDAHNAEFAVFVAVLLECGVGKNISGTSRLSTTDPGKDWNLLLSVSFTIDNVDQICKIGCIAILVCQISMNAENA